MEIEGELPYEELNTHRAAAVKKMGANLEVAGFRKGKAPESAVTEHFGEQRLLEEMATQALSEYYPKILLEKKINAIGAPEITITKLAVGNPLGFKIKTATMPAVELPDYKKIAGKVMEKESSEATVTDEDLNNTIIDIRKRTFLAKKNAEGEKNVSLTSIKDEDLPELNDELVKKLGDFENVEDFKDKIKKSLQVEKEIRAREKRRLELLEQILDKTEIEVPQIIIKAETEKLIGQFKADANQRGVKFEEYLQKINKNEINIREELKDDAKKRAQTQILLNEIAKAENIMADKNDVDVEVGEILKAHKDANKEAVKIHVISVLTNQKVFEWLEGQ